MLNLEIMSLLCFMCGCVYAWWRTTFISFWRPLCDQNEFWQIFQKFSIARNVVRVTIKPAITDFDIWHRNAWISFDFNAILPGENYARTDFMASNFNSKK